MRRGRHRLKSRASQERRQVATLDSWRRYRKTIDGFTAGTSSWQDSLDKLSASLNRFAASVLDALSDYRRPYECDFSGYGDRDAATRYIADWARTKRAGFRPDQVYGEPGPGHRVYGDYSWSGSEVIDVDGHVVEPEPAPSALEVYRGR